MKKFCVWTLLMACLTLTWVTSSPAQILQIRTCHAGHHCPKCNCEVACECETQCEPACAEYCDLKVEEVKEKKPCFKIETKSVCIPPVRLPFCQPRNCGKIRKVKVLKVDSYECPVCKYTWSVKSTCEPVEEKDKPKDEDKPKKDEPKDKSKDEPKKDEAKTSDKKTGDSQGSDSQENGESGGQQIPPDPNSPKGKTPDPMLVPGKSENTTFQVPAPNWKFSESTGVNQSSSRK